MNTFILAALWIGWCAMHSILIDTAFTRVVKARLPGLIRYYRLLYNGISLATLLPLMGYTRNAGGTVIFGWQGWGGISMRILFLASALLLFCNGAKHYDFQSFLGIKQLMVRETQVLLSTNQDFLPNGVFNITRHPWYLGSLLAIWTIFREYPSPLFVASIILSGYLVVGTLLEERKIIQEYGDRYRHYQQQVSMLFPWKWLKNRLRW
jgi:methanethiol S-methyltransferase